ncbi:MAG: GerMN domain-containing protein [Syntrophomonadaceae bacterium]|nr:GerMN domain-containing protein [Syntrophomonadaceae bacterium]
MTKKLMIALAMMILSACLISGGCSRIDDSKVDSWKDMFKIPTGRDKDTDEKTIDFPTLVNSRAEQVMVKLYFMDDQAQQLVVEERSIDKVTGIARQTVNELIKGPSNPELQAVIPAGTQLLDINIKPDGLCIVDLSREVNQVSSPQQGELMVQAIANTMGQFTTVEEVSFLVEGENANVLGGVVVALPVQADSSL